MYRVVFTQRALKDWENLDRDKIVILRVGHRKSIYK